MSNNDEEDSKPTVVLDLKELKSQLQKAEDELAGITQELEFTAESSINTDPGLEEVSLEANADDQPNPKIALFDFNSTYFQKAKDKFPKGFDYELTQDLPQLNQALADASTKVVVFNYNAAPKAVNQLCAQIKAKFPRIKTLILAKNLSPEKAKAHQATKSGAHGYVSAPFKMATLAAELKKLSLD